MCFKGESALIARVGSDIVVDGLHVSSQQSCLAKGASAFVALKLALFLVNRPHVDPHVVFAREPFLAVRAGKHFDNDDEDFRATTKTADLLRKRAITRCRRGPIL